MKLRIVDTEFERFLDKELIKFMKRMLVLLPTLGILIGVLFGMFIF